MRTDDLIAMLATGATPVQANTGRQRFHTALLLGGLGGLLVMLVGFGLRPDLGVAMLLPMFWMKLTFPLTVGLAALLLTWRLSHPGVPIGRAWVGLAVPWFIVTALAAIVLWKTAPEARQPLLMGATWSTCVANIALISVPSFVGVFWAMRGLAPTQPALAGACGGLLSAAMGALVYALHCPEMDAPFLALWYVLGLLLPTAVGALLGPKLLRW